MERRAGAAQFRRLRHDVDGKVWTKSVGTQDIFRLDVAKGTWEKFHPTDTLPGGPYGIYQVISDSQNNLWMAEFTKAISASSTPRRSR